MAKKKKKKEHNNYGNTDLYTRLPKKPRKWLRDRPPRKLIKDRWLEKLTRLAPKEPIWKPRTSLKWLNITKAELAQVTKLLPNASGIYTAKKKFWIIVKIPETETKVLFFRRPYVNKKHPGRPPYYKWVVQNRVVHRKHLQPED